MQDENGENEPLLSPRLDSAELETQRKEEKTEGSRVLGACLKYFGALTFVCAVGALAWYLSKGADEMDNGSARGGKAKEVIEWRSQLIGWMSALLYREFESLILETLNPTMHASAPRHASLLLSVVLTPFYT